jgi:uncharacterized protein involved in response to NO
VMLWPLFYGGWLGYYPGLGHARLMIEGFGGAFVLGFLGTAGPWMVFAPRLTPLELLALFAVHLASGLCHLKQWHGWGDTLFALLLAGFVLMLLVRVLRFRKEWPPPQLLLAGVGLGCGIAGAMMFGFPQLAATPEQYRLAGLFLYQGFLLAPVLGIGSFLFPRMLGGSFGEPDSKEDGRRKGLRAVLAALLLLTSFWLEANVSAGLGTLLRALVVIMYLFAEVRWRGDGETARGTLVMGLKMALVVGVVGLMLAAVFPQQRVSVEHLLYAGGFGLLMLVVGSRVLFGHSGELAGFDRRAWTPRVLVFLVLLAAATRLTTGFLPQLTVTHHVYAAFTWVVAGFQWLIWHRRRFLQRDE